MLSGDGGARRHTGLEPVRAAASNALWELLVVAVTAPLLLFPTLRPAWTAAALALLLAVWLAGWIATGRPWPRTPLNGALLLFMLTLPVGVWASAFPELTIPKLSGIILGLAAFRATVNAIRSPRHLWTASALFLALALGLALIGIVGADWNVKWSALEPILARMPRLFEGLPGAEEGIHLNELAGALVLFLPVSLARLAGRRPGRGHADLAARLAALLLALVLGAVVFLSQSRSAWIGALVAIGVMAWLRWPRWRWLMAGGATAAALALLYIGPLEALQAAFAPAEPVRVNWMADSVTLEDRFVLWSRAMWTIEDFPLTGCGLGAFRQVVKVLYPFSSWTFGTDIAHAHNVFLQAALDLGLPGLVAYLALVGTALWTAWLVARLPLTSKRDAPTASPLPSGRVAGGEGGEFSWLGLGIIGSLVAYHFYGLTDAVALGAKPGLAFWMMLGLAAALWVVQEAMGTRVATEPK